MIAASVLSVTLLGVGVAWAVGAFDGSSRPTTARRVSSTTPPPTANPAAVQHERDLGDAAAAVAQITPALASLGSALQDSAAAEQAAIDRNDVAGARAAFDNIPDAISRFVAIASPVHYPSTATADAYALLIALNDERAAVLAVIDPNNDFNTAIRNFNRATIKANQEQRALFNDLASLVSPGLVQTTLPPSST